MDCHATLGMGMRLEGRIGVVYATVCNFKSQLLLKYVSYNSVHQTVHDNLKIMITYILTQDTLNHDV